MTIAPGLVVVVAAGGEVRLDPRGHLLLTLAVRRHCRIATGDRVLAIGDRQQANLLVIPMAVVRDMVDGFHRRASQGRSGD